MLAGSSSDLSPAFEPTQGGSDEWQTDDSQRNLCFLTPAPTFPIMLNEPAPARKRLALFFDGTWNTPESKTNVWELYQLLSDTGGTNRGSRVAAEMAQSMTVSKSGFRAAV